MDLCSIDTRSFTTMIPGFGERRIYDSSLIIHSNYDTSRYRPSAKNVRSVHKVHRELALNLLRRNSSTSASVGPF